MAEIAAIFHWPLTELVAMPIDELIDWRERAVTAWNRMHAAKDGE
jgi:hypothetical protein